MKIAIMTLPLHANYGGILQAYALQQVLTGMGHEPYKIRFDRGWAYNTALQAVRTLKRHRIVPARGWHTLSKKELATIRQHTDRFIREHIRYTPPVSERGLERLRYDAFIVGSDQVWRSSDARYFLDFARKESGTRIISYGASFAVDEWPHSEKDTRRLRGYMKRFDAVSVREDSGVMLCRDHLYVDAAHVLDPTMLPGTEIYERLIETSAVVRKPGTLMSYILDESAGKATISERVSARLGITANRIMPRCKSPRKECDINDCVFPPVEEWLAGFADAEFVVTDSFHGTVFAILFNKPFITVCNEERGRARFDSLLRMFGLQDRLVYEGRQVPEALISREMDYSEVNRILERQREISLEFLGNALGENCNLNANAQ